MSKICIIGTSNIKHISLISLYTTFFKDNNIPYDIIYMDRYGIEEKTGAQNQFCYHALHISTKLDKIREFIRFRQYAKKIIKQKKYELIITWQTTSAYLFSDLLLYEYKNRFIINVRDYVIENNKFIQLLLRKLIKKASMVTISSEGFKEFLPSGEYTLVNSINNDILKDYKFIEKKKQKIIPFKIGFAGNCRYFRESYRLIDALANDERYEIWYCGTNSEKLKIYSEKKGIDNVKIMPAFLPNQTLKIFDKFDIINSAFGSDAWDNRTLMPIRLYTALSMHLPILVSARTQLAREVEKGNIGYVIDDYSVLADNLFNYLTHLNQEKFIKDCDKYIFKARKQNENFYIKLNKIVEDMN